MKKGVISVNSNAEKTIIAKKKPAKRKSFAQRVSKHYKTIDNIMLMTVAKDVKKKEQERAALKKKNSYKTKLRDLEIQDAEFIEL